MSCCDKHTHAHAWMHKSIPLVCFCVELVPSFFTSIPANLLVKQTHCSYYLCHDKHVGLTSQHFWPLWPDRTRGNMPSRRPKPCQTPGPSSTWRTSRLRAAPATGTDSRRGVWEWLCLFLLTQLLYGVLIATGEKNTRAVNLETSRAWTVDCGKQFILTVYNPFHCLIGQMEPFFFVSHSQRDINHSLHSLPTRAERGLAEWGGKNSEFLCFVSACYITRQAHWAGPSGAAILPRCSLTVC